jgi:hypothetical protein
MTGSDVPLYLHEEIMLLALHDNKGTAALGSMHQYALAGAILAELLLAERVSVEQGNKKLVNIASDEPFGEPLIDECFGRIITAKRRARAQTWVQRFAYTKKLHHRVAQGLCTRGILRVDEDTVLLFFHRNVYPEIDPKPERMLIQRLEEAIFGDDDCLDPRTSVLVSLADSAHLLTIPFNKKDLRSRKKRIQQISNGHMMGEATKSAVQAAEAAMLAAAIMPAMAASASS